MEAPVIIGLIYIAIGAAIFAHPPRPFSPGDFHWRRQIAIFRGNFRDVMVWPLTLWLWAIERR
jgi:hypothetical protein